MNPFPKSVSLFMIVAAIFGALNSADVLAVVGPKIGGVISVVAVLASALSHSLTGTGGKPPEA